MTLIDAVYRQFKSPTGALGSLVGHVMAFKNRARGRWVTEQLGVRDGMRVLEIGCGPGADAARVLSLLGSAGSFVGVDASSVMVRQAAARNRKAVDQGRASFVHGDISKGLDSEPDAFDVAFSINCAQFWPDLTLGLTELGRVVREGGRIVVAVQPRRRGATEADSESWSVRLSDAAAGAGLKVIDVERGATRPSTAVLLAQR